MTEQFIPPSAAGQLVWSPANPNLGIGLVTDVDGPRVWVRFLRLQQERAYTTRGPDPVIVRYPISAGDPVQTADGRAAHVSRQLESDGDGLLHYELDDGSAVPETQLIPKVRDIGAKERLGGLNLVHPEAVRGRVQGLQLANAGERPGHAAVLGARALWLPHQIDVATRAVDADPARLLLADEVGLGKTVEAALIYAGLRHEGRADRVLILAPDALCIQWLGEIYRKAHELLVLMDSERLEDAFSEHGDLNPFEAHQRLVVSIDELANDAELAEQAASAQWDLVIVDEAHHLKWNREAGGNAGYQLVEQLARSSHHLLLLTATPMALDPAEYHALLRLLDPVRFDAPTDFQAVVERVATIRDAGREIAAAVAEQRPIEPGLAERAAEVLADDPADVEVAQQLVQRSPTDTGRAAEAERVLGALRERHALADYVVRNRRGPVGGMPERRAHVVGLEPTDAQDILIEVGEGVAFDLARAVADPQERTQRLGQMLRALWATPHALTSLLMPFSPELVGELEPLIAEVTDAPLDEQRLPTGDARLRWLVQTIRSLEPEEKLLVFVESVVAVRALREALAGLLNEDIAVFHRELAPRDQDRQVAWFRDAVGPRVMLSTEAGGEGRNFQFCHKVVLYDLPWRPATVEQRIGRVDRVGQQRDVDVLVPHFKGGYEAAILKVMQECIGVLDSTVGGIDHQLEYVSGSLGELILEEADVEAWKDLYRQTAELIRASSARINAGIDPILDYASYSPERHERVLDQFPSDLEQHIETFVHRYAEHSKLRMHARGEQVWVEGGPGAASNNENAFVATFSRAAALDHEDIEFLSIGHPLVDAAFEWAREDHEASAALALCRGFSKDGAVFLWHFNWELPDDVAEASAYLSGAGQTLALDEAGARVPEMDTLLLDESRSLDRMDPKPLRQNLKRWAALVEQNYQVAEQHAEALLQKAVRAAQQRLDANFDAREKHLRRAHAREVAGLSAQNSTYKHLEAAFRGHLERLHAEKARVEASLGAARPRLVAAVAVRLVRVKEVSG